MSPHDPPIQRGKTVHANGLRIYYEEYGSGDPLILLHGGTLTCHDWGSLIDGLAEHFRVLALDSRGHGRTDNPTGEFSYRGMAGDVAAFSAVLELDGPLVYGFSDGAQIALELGMRYPDLPQALVLAGAYIRADDDMLTLLKNMGFEGPGRLNLAQFQRSNPGWATYLQEAHVRSDDPDYWQTLLRQISVMWYAPVHYSAEELGQIKAPTLILLGDRDEMIRVEQGLEIYRMIPIAELAIVPNANHDATNSAPGVPAMVLDFLTRHSQEKDEGGRMKDEERRS